MRFVFLTSGIMFFATSAFAADLGQYRPGNPYQSVIAAGADICDSHCAGDALCRSWNYVKVNPQAPGVCEFNSNSPAPIASTLSISGTNIDQTYRSGLVQGGTNTIRVGTRSTVSDRTVNPRIGQTQRGNVSRKIIRETVPVQSNPQFASTRSPVNSLASESLTEQQNRSRNIAAPRAAIAEPRIVKPQTGYVNEIGQLPQRGQIPPRFQHDLGGQMIRRHAAPSPIMQQRRDVRQPSYSRASQSRRHNQGPNVRHEQRPIIQDSIVQRQNTQRQISQGQPFPPQGQIEVQTPAQNQAARTGQPYPPQMTPSQISLPQNSQTHNSLPNNVDTQPQEMMRRPASNPPKLGEGPTLSTAQAQQSLFGKLNDDVRTPNSGSAVPTDPNLPIPTAMSRPIQPVHTSRLGGLAGGPL